MSKNKKLSPQEVLGTIKISEDGTISEKSPEEIAKEEAEKKKIASLLVNIKDSNFHKTQKSPISQNRESFAPYNFVPLNDKIVLSDFDNKTTPFDKYHTDRFTGNIELCIEAKTPLYIRDTYTEEQLKEIKNLDDSLALEIAKRNRDENEINRLENAKITKLWEYCDFYSPGNGNAKLPGSAQRGMVKNLVEIASYGKFKDFEDKRLYMRGFADKSLRSQYSWFGMSSFKGSVSYSMNCGILIKANNKYIIKDCGIPTQIPISNSKARIVALGKAYSDYEFYEDILASEYIVVSGPIPRKQNDWIIPFPLPTAAVIILTAEDIQEYNDDENRLKDVNLIKRLSNSSGGIPCFYKQWPDTSGIIHTTFGHTGMFRVPYRFTIGEHVPDELKNTKETDFAEAIFGNKEEFAGRVFFEDAECTKLIAVDTAKHPKILSNPKPTTFQHYLIQPEEGRNELKHYNPDNSNMLSELRGYKLYWHKINNDWFVEEAIAEDSKKQYTKIKPVGTGSIFNGLIRFENLSSEELGALLFVLQLPPECNHKIGMAKPLGLGSIFITPILYLSNRKARYSSIESEWCTEKQESKRNGEKIIDFKNAFANYILKVLNQEIKDYTSEDLWKDKRMEELKKMLTFNHGISSTKLDYMHVTEFTKRQVLPKPSDVIKEE